MKQPDNNMMAKFFQFKKMIEGKDINEMINSAVSRGRYSQSQINSAMEQAKLFANIFK